MRVHCLVFQASLNRVLRRILLGSRSLCVHSGSAGRIAGPPGRLKRRCEGRGTRGRRWEVISNQGRADRSAPPAQVPPVQAVCTVGHDRRSSPSQRAASGPAARTPRTPYPSHVHVGIHSPPHPLAQLHTHHHDPWPSSVSPDHASRPHRAACTGACMITSVASPTKVSTAPGGGPGGPPGRPAE